MIVNLIDLFTGIGGFSLASEWIGWNVILQVEWDDWCQKLLNKRFPDVKKERDIREVNGKPYAGTVHIVSGGFPCQPFSGAGKRKGSADDRFLWPEMFRIVQESKPAFVVGENVAGLISMENDTPFEKWVQVGMESENYIRRKYSRYIYRKRQSYILNEIIEDLERENYTVETFVIPACAVGAWHRRDRIWIIAYINSNNRSTDEGKPNRESNRGNISSGVYKDVSNSKSERIQGCRPSGEQESFTYERPRLSLRNSKRREHTGWDAEPNVGRVVHGVSSTLDETLNDYKYGNSNDQETITKVDLFRGQILRDMWSERQEAQQTSYRTESGENNDIVQSMSHGYSHERWKLGDRFKENKELRNMWEGVCAEPFQKTQDLQQKMLEYIRENERNEKVASSRVDRIKGLGNAIVPQVVYEIFKAIDKIIKENELPH